MVKVGDVLAAQLDHYPAQGCWVIHSEVAATDRALAVLINEVKNPTFVALKVEQQSAHSERVPRLPVDALVLNPRLNLSPVAAIPRVGWSAPGSFLRRDAEPQAQGYL